jgi:hypothetical protein
MKGVYRILGKKGYGNAVFTTVYFSVCHISVIRPSAAYLAFTYKLKKQHITVAGHRITSGITQEKYQNN